VPARRGARPEAGVVRVLDATGASPIGWEAAVADALRGVRKDVRAPLGVEVTRQWADLQAGRITTYRVAVRVAYRQKLKAPSRRAS
jgi:flavin-binding protein dodecin